MVVIKRRKRGMGALNYEGEVESPKRQVLSKRNHQASSPLFQLCPLKNVGLQPSQVNCFTNSGAPKW
jgi:hypothetical protein